MSGWKIDSVTETEIAASKPQGNPEGVNALLSLVAKELKIPEGHIEYVGPGRRGGTNTATIAPLRGHEDAFAAATKTFNERNAES